MPLRYVYKKTVCNLSMMIRQDLHLHSDQNHVLIYSINLKTETATGFETHNHLVRKRTPNHLVKLV